MCNKIRLHNRWKLLAAAAVLLAGALGAVFIGATEVSWADFWSAESAVQQRVIWDLRVPRIVNAVLVGALLSLAGLMIQNLLKNPLADPYVLGISGAAASTQLLLLMWGVQMSLTLFTLFGLIGSVLAMGLVLRLSYRAGIHSNRLLLNGVVMAFGFAALISFMLSVAPERNLKSMMFWLMGDLSYAGLNPLAPLVLLAGSLWVFYRHRAMDLMARGEVFAAKTGVSVNRMNLMLFTVSSLFTATAVSLAGSIGFVGLVVPHIGRLLVGHAHRDLIPMVALLGGVFLLFSDTLARSVMAPLQLPVGVFTALLGVPVFLFLNRHRGPR